MEIEKMVFTIDTREALRVKYETAVAKSEEVFVFNGHTFRTGYAKYLLEYLDQHLGPTEDEHTIH